MTGKRKKTSADKTTIIRIREFLINNKTLVFTSITIVVLDKLTKLLIKYLYEPGHSFNVIGNFFKITYIENRGIAFGLGSNWNHPLKSLVLLLLSLAALAIIFNIYYQIKKTFINKLSFGLIFGGALGNIYDRLIDRKVIDFLDFNFPDIRIGSFYLDRWPIFNIADTSITIGLIMIVIFVFFNKEEK